MTQLFTIAVLVLSFASNGCKQVDETKIADKAACGAMIKSIEVNNRLLAATTRQIIDADRALRMADRWNRKQVTDAEEGSGLFSGAAHRAVMHAGSAHALCEAARQVHAGIESIARQVHEPAVHVDEHTLDRPCFDQFMVDAPDKPAREEVAEKWQTEVIWYQAAESRYGDACKAKFGVEDVSVDGFTLGGMAEPDIK